jgi:P27 family predicted phage terminase small subunit
MRGRKPKPTVLHALHGTGNTTRLKARKHEPIAAGDLSEPPDWLTPEQKRAWRYAIEHAPRNLLKPIDRNILVIWVEAETRHRTATMMQITLDKDNALPLLAKAKNGAAYVSPYLSIINHAALLMLKSASELGFSPASRPRLSAEAPVATGDSNDPWSRLKLLEHDESTTNH